MALEIRIMNHSPRPETYRLKWNLPAGWRVVEAETNVTVPARREGSARAVIATGGAGLHVITADVEFAGRQLREWTESLVRVEP